MTLLAQLAIQSTYVTLDTSNEQSISITLRVLDEIGRRLFSWDGDERDTLVGGLEPDDLGAFDDLGTLFLAMIAFTLAALSLLLFLRGSRRGPEKTKSA